MSAPIARGRTAEILPWLDGRVLKLFYDWCPPGWAEHEAEVVRVVSASGFRTPRALEVVDVDGRKGIVYDRIEGPSLLRVTVAEPWRLYWAARQFSQLHVAMHARRVESLRPVRESLARATAETASLPAEMKQQVLGVLEGLPDGDALCHMDFHPDQVILSTGGPVVIDWMTAGRGAPLADVARTLLVLTVGQLPGAGWATRLAVGTWRRLFRQAYLSRYLAASPALPLADLDRWMVVTAAARLNERIPGEDRHLLKIVRSRLGRSTPRT